MLRIKRLPVNVHTKSSNLHELKSNSKVIHAPDDGKLKITGKKRLISEVIDDNEIERVLEEKVIGSCESKLVDENETNFEISSENNSDDEAPVEKSSKSTSIWFDEDDSHDVSLPKSRKMPFLYRTGDGTKIAGENYSQRLKMHFEKTTGLNPSWADSNKISKNATESDQELDDAELELTRSTGNYLAKNNLLSRYNLAFKRLKDVTFGHKSRKPLNCVRFHPSTKVLLTAGDSGKVDLFQLNDDDNPLLQNCIFENFPIKTARLSFDGRKAIFSTNIQQYFYTYDLMTSNVDRIPFPKAIIKQCMPIFELSPDGQYLIFCGKYGEIHLLSANSMEWITSLKMNGSVAKIAFSHSDPSLIYSIGDRGQVNIWDIKMHDIVHKFADEGAIKGTSLAISNNGKYLACGCNTGIVNLYETATIYGSSEPNPVKTISNLTTSADFAEFNKNAEILAIGSNSKENSLRFLHVKSRTIFDNFPENSKNKTGRLAKVLCGDFSPNGAYFCAGNEKGQGLLFRINHYEEY